MILRIYIIFLIHIYCVIGNKNCSPREFGKGNIVCVCNTTYCDTVDPPQLEKGFITIVESNKQGKRFWSSNAKFQNRKEFDKHSWFETYVDITLQRDKEFQSIIGFGGAFTDSATINIKNLPDYLSRRLIADYFALDGLQYNIGRIPIGGSDFSTRKYTYDDIPNGTDFQLKSFKLAEEDIKFKIPAIKIAKNVSPENIYLFGSAWGPPGWMKTNNDTKGVGVLKGPTDGPYYKTWANYAIKFLQAYRSHDIELWGMTAGNEPLSAKTPLVWWNSLGFTAETQRDFIKLHLGPALETAGYTNDKFNVIIFDDQLPSLPKFADKIYGDKDASKYVSGAGFHWYANYLNAYDNLDKVHNKFPEKFLLATEACEGSIPTPMTRGVRLGHWSRAVSYAKDILEDLNKWASGWVDWNLALDMNGGPNWANNFVDAPVIVNKDKNEYYKNPMFYAMGHFSKYIKRFSRRIGFQERKSAFTQTMSVIFKTPDNEIVLVVLNRGNKKVKYSIYDPQNGLATLTLSENSITTLIWN